MASCLGKSRQYASCGDKLWQFYANKSSSQQQQLSRSLQTKLTDPGKVQGNQCADNEEQAEAQGGNIPYKLK